MVKLPKNFGLIAPFATWIALMTVLPATATAYAVRTAATAALLAATAASLKLKVESLKCWRWSDLVLGLAVGMVVFAIWILPEQFDWAWYRKWCILGEGGTKSALYVASVTYRKWCIIGEGGTQAVAEASAVMIAIRLIGSAFVISIAEELFFRKWLIGFAGFWWMVALFAIEHDRWLVAALCGIIYGALYLRRGLGAACVAHATTNLLLGLWVLLTGQWQFW